MEAALHHHHTLAVQHAAYQHARMPRHSGHRKAGDLAVRQPFVISKCIGVIAQTAAQNHADFGIPENRNHLFGRLIDSFHFVHHTASQIDPLYILFFDSYRLYHSG